MVNLHQCRSPVLANQSLSTLDFTGFSVFMFGATMWVLLYHRGGQKVNRAMIAVACALFVFSTMVSSDMYFLDSLDMSMTDFDPQHIGVDIQRIIEGLVYNRDFPAGGPPVWFEDVSAFTFVFKSAIYSFQTVTGDGVVVSNYNITRDSSL